jgi:glyoxylase-like metal-dependent hydrolase (beta-lactamase superfamily II)
MLLMDNIAVGSWQANCYRLANPATGQGILIDPGDEAKKILDWVGDIQITKILLTHGDHDHVGALAAVQAALKIPTYIHPADADHFGIKTDHLIEAGDLIELDNYVFEVAHIPGHTPGEVAFRIIEGGEFQRAIVGDAIFPGGPGHTKSPEALNTALESLAQTVFTWEDHITLYPGHGGPTTVGAERAAFEAFMASPRPADLHGDVAWR